MAEELYFIKTNPVVAKINLYNKLCREEENAVAFLEEDRKTSLEILKKKVKDSIDTFSNDEFFSVLNWIAAPYDGNPEEVQNQLFINGLDLFYKIPSKTPVRSFHRILSDYERLTEQDFNRCMPSGDFNHFLIFGIFFSTLLSAFLDQHDDKTPDTGDDDHLILIKMLKDGHGRLFELAQAGFDSHLETFKEDITGLEKIAEYERENSHQPHLEFPMEFNTFLTNEKEMLNTAFSYHHFLELYEHTKFYKGNIIWLHSY